MIGSTAGRRRLDPSPCSVYPRLSAGVAKLVDARDLKSLGPGRAGSTPAARTKPLRGGARRMPVLARRHAESRKANSVECHRDSMQLVAEAAPALTEPGRLREVYKKPGGK